jgi:translation initiation factor IF-3
LSRPFPPRHFPPRDFTRVNNKIRAREVRLIGENQQQLGVMSLNEALALARQRGVDLVEIAAAANPPVCRLVDYGKFRYEQAKKDKESKKHQHANRVKEIQLSANIDPHDFGVKLTHAIDFLCEDMKVKITLRFRGREMAHQEFGFGQVQRFIKEVAPFGHPDAPPKLIGKGLNVMISPLPRNKRAPNPNQGPKATDLPDEESSVAEDQEDTALAAAPAPESASKPQKPQKQRVPTDSAENGSFGQNPFAQLDLTGRQ